MNRVYLLLGSNMGNREVLMESACGLLIERLLPDYLEVEDLSEAVNTSEMYETEAWGFESETKFLNMAFVTLTEYEPVEILEICKEIERELGREDVDDARAYDGNGKRIYSARPIDIDIIFFDRENGGTGEGGKKVFEPQVVELEELKIPHPLMQERMFVLDPLSDIAGDYSHPVLKKSVRILRKELKTNKRS